MGWKRIIVWPVVLAAAGLSAQAQAVQSNASHMSFTMTISAFAAGAAIPRQYTCEGSDQSPALQWSETPKGTVTFAVVVHDPDAPAGDWVHWVAWNIPASSHELAENFPRQQELADGTRQGRNDFRKIGYNGPCPPPGRAHRYYFRVYAVDEKLDLAPGATRAQLDSALKGHVLAEAEYMGTYRR
jgi:Raf kinase inhibitor-like YbhB/YbcL family protein